MKVAIIGYGVVGKAYHQMFPDAVIYDEPQKLGSRIEVNACDLALVCVPTNLVYTDEEEKRPADNTMFTADPWSHKPQLDMSIVGEVVGWLETPLILIKSALQPGTVDRLVKETSKKIAVSVEFIGEGNYSLPYWKYPHQTDPRLHQMLIVGGEEETARACADVLWSRMSPDTDIHLISAVEAEITKLMENTWGAMKVTFGNVIFDICQKYGANYTKVLQAWGSDGRTEKMHMRVMPGKRGWKSKCYDKDIPALAELDDSGFLKKLVEVNKEHLNG